MPDDEMSLNAERRLGVQYAVARARQQPPAKAATSVLVG
jgi:hypothetical protein